MAITQTVVVVGGGMVGAAAACAIRLQGFEVVLVEPHPPVLDAPVPEAYGLRVSALTLASRQILNAVGAWPLISAKRLQPFQEMHVWDAQGSAEIHFNCADIAQPELGYLVENSVVQQSLWQRLRALDVALQTAPVSAIEAQPNGVHRLTLADGRQLGSALLVVADGARSAVRQMLHIDCHEKDYGHTAIVATVKPQQFHANTAWQRFMPSGPLAFLPLPEGYCSIVWSVTTDKAEDLLALPSEVFARQLGEAFEYRLGEVQLCSDLASFVLRERHVQHYVQPGLALVGDAAHTIHPLAGQGVNLGLLDAASLAQVLGEAQRKQQSVGEYLVLRRYERWRKGHNALVMAMMGGFKQLFGNTWLPVVWVRNLGVQLVNQAGPLKRELILQAAGLKGDLPELAKCYTKSGVGHG